MPHRSKNWTREQDLEVTRKWRRSEQGREKCRARAKRQYARLKEITNEVKLTAGCVDCGFAQHPAALDFDHQDPAAKHCSPSQMLAFGRERFWEEVMKCDIRCANCHRVRHASEGSTNANEDSSDDYGTGRYAGAGNRSGASQGRA